MAAISSLTLRSGGRTRPVLSGHEQVCTSAQGIDRSLHVDEIDEQTVPFKVRDLRLKVRARARACAVVAGLRPSECAERGMARVLERLLKRLTDLDAAADRERCVDTWMPALVSHDAHPQLALPAGQFGRRHRLMEFDWDTLARRER